MSERADQVQRVAEMLRRGCNVAVHGSPGAGKTWLTDQVIKILHEQTIKAVRLDLSIMNSGAEAFASAAAGVRGRSSSEPAESSVGLHAAWRDLREALGANEHRVVLVLDELDAVVRYEDGLDFLRLLRETVHRPTASQCNALFVSRRSLETIESEVRGISTLASLCFAEYLGAVTPADLSELWDDADGLTDASRQECISWAAGHPTLVQYWLSARPDLHPSVGAEQQQVAVMERLLDHLDLLGLRDAAAQLVLGPVLDDWLIESKQLQTLGVIACPDGGLAQHEVFLASLRRRTWSLDPWGLLGQAEIRSRGLIEDVLTAAEGPQWAEGLSRRSAGVRSAYEAAQEKRDRDTRQFGRAGSWLAYTYPNELWQIMSATWPEFAGVFPDGDKKYWQLRFEGMARYRTPLAHNRADSLSEAQRAECRIFAEQILRSIETFYLREGGPPVAEQ